MNLSIASLWDAFSLQGLVSESVILSIDLAQSTSSSLRSVESTAQSPLQRFEGFIQALESNKIDTSGLQRLFFEVAEIQSQKQALQHHLEALKTMSPNAKRAERIEEASKQLEVLVSMQTIFTNACFKSGQSGIRGYWQRLWSNESWSEWSSARTDLGKLVLLASDYAYGTFSSESLPYKLRERGIDLDRVHSEAKRVLQHIDKNKVNRDEVELEVASGRSLQEVTTTFAISPTETLLEDETILPPVTTLDEQITQDGSQAVPNANFPTNHSTTFLETLSVNGTSQYGQPTFYHAELMSNGDMVLMGCYRPDWPDGDSLVLLSKIDVNGDLLWSQSIQFEYPCLEGNAIAKVENDSVILTGFSDDSYDPILMKFDSDGNVLWSEVFSGADLSRYSYVEGISSGGFSLVGNTGYSQGAEALDVLIAKMGPDGALDWAKTVGGLRQDDGMVVKEMQDGGFVLAGCSVSYTDNDAALVVRLNAQGDIIWSEVLEETQGCVWDVDELSKGDLVLIGNNLKSKDISGSLVVRLNASGSLIWAKALSVGTLFDLVALDNEEMVFATYTYAVRSMNDALLFKLDDHGAFDWVHYFEQPVVPGTSFSGNLQFIDIGNNGDVIVAGYGYGGGLIARVNASGWIADCTQVKNLSISDASYSTALDNIDVTANILVTPVVLSTKNVTSSMQMLPFVLNATNLTSTVIQKNICPDVAIKPRETTTGMFVKSTVYGAHTTFHSSTKKPETTGKSTTKTSALASSNTPAETFFEVFGGSGEDWAYGIGELKEGEYLFTGFTSSYGDGGSNVLRTELDNKGGIQRATMYGGSNDDVGYGIAITPEGKVVQSGYTTSFGDGSKDFLLMKWDQNGEPIWTKILGGSGNEESFHLIVDDGIVASGYTTSFGMGYEDALLTKWSQDGELLWAKALGGAWGEKNGHACITIEGDYLVNGNTQSIGNSEKFMISKWSSNGTLYWSRVFGGTIWEQGHVAHCATDGSIMLMGDTLSFGAGNMDALMVKLDQNGELQWAKTIGGLYYDTSEGFQEMADGSFIFTGLTYSFGSGSSDVFVVKLNQEGELQWARAFGGDSLDSGMVIQETSDGGFLVSGYTESFGSSDDAFVAKLNASGWIDDCSFIREVFPTVMNVTDQIVYQSINFTVTNIPAFAVSSVNFTETDITEALRNDTNKVCPKVDIVTTMASSTDIPKTFCISCQQHAAIICHF